MPVVAKDDWSLDRRGKIAQSRHAEKIKDAIRKQLKDLITKEDLVFSDGKKVVRVPIRSMDEPRITYGNNKKVSQKGGRGGRGEGEGGEEAGEFEIEVDVQLDYVAQELFSRLYLPNTHPTSGVEDDEDIDFTDLRKTGIRANLDRKRTFREALKRSVATRQPLTFQKDDLRFKTWEEKETQDISAVIIAMMDVSGSMGDFEKNISRLFFFWTEQFLHTKYKSVQFRFIVHHVEAREVDRDTFFSTRESGGTVISSALTIAQQMIDRDYPLDSWNIYPVYVGDGDNSSADKTNVISLLNQMAPKCSRMGYIEVGPHAGHQHSTSHSVAQETGTTVALVQEKEQLIHALEKFFRSEG